MNRRTILGFIAVAVVLAAGFVAYLWHGAAPAPAGDTHAASGTLPHIEHPLGPAPDAALPALADSDGPLSAAIAALLQSAALPDAFFPTQLAHRFVATIDNLPREQVAVPARLLQPAAGSFAVDDKDGAPALAAANSARYARYLDILRRTDPQEAVALYRRFYPLFQQSYEELGYPGHYFNDRVVEAIDNLLATPDVASPVPLVRPSVMYRFADPNLESLSAGQKALVRLGRDGALEVKARLRAIRALIVAQPHA
jgi:Protein of unknown function (DUF3014)